MKKDLTDEESTTYGLWRKVPSEGVPYGCLANYCKDGTSVTTMAASPDRGLEKTWLNLDLTEIGVIISLSTTSCRWCSGRQRRRATALKRTYRVASGAIREAGRQRRRATALKREVLWLLWQDAQIRPAKKAGYRIETLPPFLQNGILIPRPRRRATALKFFLQMAAVHPAGKEGGLPH